MTDPQAIRRIDGRQRGVEAPEIRRNEDGTLDEVVARVCDFHMEQLGDDQWWMSIRAGGMDVHVTFYRKGKRILANLLEMRDPPDLPPGYADGEYADPTKPVTEQAEDDVEF